MTEIVVGSKIGEQDRYEITRLLGHGGMADVYLATDGKLKRQVALKFIAEHMTRQPEFVTKFLAEARILANLENEHIVRVFDVEEHEHRPYLSMQYIDGRSLFDMKGEGPWPADRVLKWLRGLASALDYAHARNVLHRDIKSANIMVSADDRAILTDFGVAAFVADALITGGSTPPPDGSHGTLAYSSPEQIDDRVVGPPSDIFSLGVVIYEALAGRLPFEASSSSALTNKILNEPSPSLSTINPKIPPGVAAAVDRALQKKPEERYRQAKDFADAFATALRGEIDGHPPAPPPVKEPYTVAATSSTPALIIYLLDISRSMSSGLGGTRRIEVVKEALDLTAREIVSRSTKGSVVSPRYRMAVLGYTDQVYDLFTGEPYRSSDEVVRTVTEIARRGLMDKLDLEPRKTTNTAAAFEAAEDILRRELPRSQKNPAPLVCHLTDGKYTENTADPEPIAARIKSMRVPDGNVLIETVFISDNVIPQAVTNIHQWHGIGASTTLVDQYAEKLRTMSSTLPDSWRVELNRQGYPLDRDSAMLLPGTSTDLVGLAFQMSGLTGWTPKR